MTNEAGHLPLSGVRVIEVGVWIQGPLAGQLLADLGATVIKVERPQSGDMSRGLKTLYGAPMEVHGTSILWELCNRGKQSICIELTTASGHELLRRLVESADVFLTNLQTPVPRRFRASREELCAVNDRLIYAFAGEFSVNGPLAAEPAQDTVAMAHSGFMSTIGSATGDPTYPPGAIADVLGATSLAFGIVTALLGRDRGAEGRMVTTSLVQSMLWAQMLNIASPANTGVPLARFDPARLPNPLMGIYRCGDGRWIALGIVSTSNRTWRSFCTTTGRAEWTEGHFGATAEIRLRRAGELGAMIRELLSSAPAASWVDRLRAHELPCAVVNRPEELLDDAGVRADGLLPSTADGLAHVSGPFSIEGNALSSNGAPPLGADTVSVLSDIGLGDDDIALLFERGSIE